MGRGRKLISTFPLKSIERERSFVSTIVPLIIIGTGDDLYMMESESAFEKCKLESEELKIENAR